MPGHLDHFSALAAAREWLITPPFELGRQVSSNCEAYAIQFCGSDLDSQCLLLDD